MFVPLTTLTMDGIRPDAMGNATSLYNLIRNVGGGVGIAMATTFVSRFGQINMHRLSEHVDLYGAGGAMLRQMTQAFIARGGDPVMAQQQALAVLYGVTQREASMLSFIQMFRLLGVVCFALIPLIALLRRPHHRGPDLDGIHPAEF
jgi:DHA2 family multidrug resistance protein